MRIVQMVTALGYGDAVGNNILAIADTLRSAGYETAVYAENWDSRIEDETVQTPGNFRNVTREDVLIYHLATGAELNFRVADYPCRKVLVYHNVTPPGFFAPYDRQVAENCRYGIEGMRFLAGKVDLALADSAFNAEDLVRAGYTCPVRVLPILIRFSDYEAAPDAERMTRYADGRNNILFVGRVAPNKKLEDIISAFSLYRKYYDQSARLILAGSYSGMDNYYSLLRKYCDSLGTEGIEFTGHIRFNELLACYRSADLFLCQSEHEGFCVPLVESMYFNIPVIAYKAAAVPDTLSGAGIVLEKKDPLETAAVMNRVIADKALRENMAANGRERLKDFSHEKIRKDFLSALELLKVK